MNTARLDAILETFRAFHAQDPESCPGPDYCMGAAAIRDLELYIGEAKIFKANGTEAEATYPAHTVAEPEPAATDETLAAISAARDSLPLVIEP